MHCSFDYSLSLCIRISKLHDGRGKERNPVLKKCGSLRKHEQGKCSDYDKTGTINRRKPSVEKVFSTENKEEDLLQMIA
jgi:Cu2+-exporting ATPase